MSFNVSPVYVCVPQLCLVPKEARKRVSDPPGTGVAVLLEMEPGLFDNKIAQSVAQSQHVGVLPAVSCDKQRSLLREVEASVYSCIELAVKAFLLTWC